MDSSNMCKTKLYFVKLEKYHGLSSDVCREDELIISADTIRFNF